jgi:hypothetical protein
LTAEPDPDVVVTDLRETVFIGPILTALDRFLTPLAQQWKRARAKSLYDVSSERFAARPIQAVSTLVLVMTLVNILLLAIDSPSLDAVGSRLIVLSLALAGTRVTASLDQLSEMRIYESPVALLAPLEPSETAGRDDTSRK